MAACCSLLAQDEPVAETPIVKTLVDASPITEAPITDADRAHWAFTAIVRHPLPRIKDASWLRTGMDGFVLAKLEAKGIAPAADASRATVLRRLSFDLIGLPPTPRELAAFEADHSPDAYERQVDRLLASPAFGDRWGQHWLDLARFAETDGFEHDYVRPEAWRFRDWVISAINRDMPYDEFIRLQLAGDEIEEAQGLKSEPQNREGDAPAEALSSTPKDKNQKPKAPPPTPGQIPSMFCLAGPDMPDVNDQAERRHNLLNELTGTVGSVFLGLQMGCAQCHDHKYDPLSQADFYRLRAVFEPAVATLKRDVPFNALANQKDVALARFWIRGDHRRPGPELQPAFPRIASPTLARSASEGNAGRIPDTSELSSKGKRTELAAWLVNDNNPLTSRVIANRLWQHHVGRGICQTPSDFGVMGGPVTHPELLDWLAIELREQGWSLKRLHRLIITSATYRQASTNSGFRIHNSELQANTPQSAIRNPQSTDADNSLYSHFPRRRLEGEAIRDAMLAAAGLLTSERGGPGVMPPLPQELLSTLLKNQWAATKHEADHYRRSIYVFARRNLRYPIFEAFDRPDGNASCSLRSRSTTAPQSLLLFNSEFSLLAARHLAGRILNTEEPKDQRTTEQTSEHIERLYLIALARRPSSSEAQTLESFLTHQQQRLAAEARSPEALALPVPCPDSANRFAAAALVDACLAVLNANEFIYVD